MKRTWQWILPLLLIAGSRAGLAQSTNSGDIRGTVTDASGALIPDVTVTVLDVNTGVSKDFTTNQDGLYDTSSIIADSYKLTFTKPGFATYVRGPITVQVGFTTVNAALKVGSNTEQVIVTTDVPLLETEQGGQTVTLDSKSMAQLPQVTQDWENFMILLPGTAGTPGSSAGAANPGQEVSVNGNLPYSNVLADGASTTLSHSANANPAIFETVSELQVSTSSFSAQYGIGGMIMNQISKGGTSSFHGAGYDYLQNDDLNATQYGFASAPTIPFLRYNNFGAAVGGPVLKKKMFFYFDYDQIVDHGSASGTNSIPTPAVMGGDFTGQYTIYDPTTQTIAMDSAGNPYPVRKSFQEEYGSNAIPAGLLSTVATNFQKYYPTANNHIAGGKFVTGSDNGEGVYQNNFYAQLPQSTPYRKYFGRLDYDITPNNRLTISDTQSDTPVLYPSTVSACPIGCQMGDVDNNNAQISDVWNISSTVINEARIGFTSQLNFYQDLSLNKGYAASLGWQFGVADDIPAIQYTRDYPYAWINPSLNASYKEFVFDPSDVVTMIRGKHILHFGGEFLLYRDDSTAWGNTNAGTLQFSGQYTENWTLNAQGVASPNTSSGLEYADFLLGYAQNWSAQVLPEYGARLKSPQMFIQDDWKIKPNLTINVGLRYQINHGWNETHGNEDSFDPTIVNSGNNTLGGMWYGSTHVNGRTSLEDDVLNTFLPRAGFSWQPKNTMTVRGAFGLYAYNWSLDTYGSGMGAPFGSSGNASDQTNGLYPITLLDGTGTNYQTGKALPYVSAATNSNSYNDQAVSFQQYKTPVPKIYQWNFAIQKQLGSAYVAEIAYVGSHGFDLSYPTDLNAVPVYDFSSSDTSTCGQGTTVGCARPYANYTNITGSSNNGMSNYSSLQASITKRMTQGFSLSFNYVWSHFLDDQDSSAWGSREGPQNYQEANNPGANYSNSNFDIRNAFKGYAVYQLPFGKGKRFLNHNALLDEGIGGWQLSTTINLSSGNPYSVFATQQTYQGAGSAFPNRIPGVSTKPTHQTARCISGSGGVFDGDTVGCANEWYNPAAFSLPANGTFGSVRRNSLYGPGIDQVNISAGKTFSVPWENIKIALRADAANAFNHASFSPPTGTLVGQANQAVGDPYTYFTKGASGAYDVPSQQISGTTVGGRNIQFGMRVSF